MVEEPPNRRRDPLITADLPKDGQSHLYCLVVSGMKPKAPLAVEQEPDRLLEFSSRAMREFGTRLIEVLIVGRRPGQILAGSIDP